jgi:hypothetical protein
MLANGRYWSRTVIDVYFFLFIWKKAKELIQDGGQIKRETDIYHHGPRPQSIICQLPDPPFYSLVAPLTIILLTK